MKQLDYDLLKNEEQILLLTSKINMSEDEEKRVQTLLEEGFDIGRYTSLAVKHKVLQLSSGHLIRLDTKDTVDVQFKRLFEYNYLGNKEKNKSLFQELQNVLRRFDESNLKAIPVKGVILAPEMYVDYGLRTLNDLDFIIQPEDRSAMSTALLQEGYIIGDYDWATEEIIPATKQEILMWKMNVGNLHPHVKKIDNPFIKCVRIDFSYDVDLQKDYLATNSLMQNAEKGELLGLTTYRLDSIDFLLHLSIHLYKEASNVKWIMMGSEISLIKFCDFREYLLRISEGLDWQIVYQRAKQLQAVTAMYYSLFFCNLLYRENFGNDFLHQICDIEIEEIDQFGKLDYGESMKWEKPFIERFFNDSNKNELTFESKMDQFKEMLSK